MEYLPQLCILLLSTDNLFAEGCSSVKKQSKIGNNVYMNKNYRNWARGKIVSGNLTDMQHGIESPNIQMQPQKILLDLVFYV